MKKSEKMTLQDKLLKDYANLDLKKLPDVIKKHGYQFQLIERENGKCLYAQRDGGHIVAYEVFQTKIGEYRKNMARFLGDAFKPEEHQEYSESYPSDEEFGKRAWTYPTLELAQAAYNNL